MVYTLPFPNSRHGTNDLFCNDFLPYTATYLVGQGVVVPLPAELCVDVSLAGQGLASLDDLEVGNVEFWVLDLELFGGDHNALLEERFVDDAAVLLGNDHLQQGNEKSRTNMQ